VASGAMGTVWRARDEVLGRAVAVKVLHDRLARDPAVLERFRAEAVSAARLSHSAVIRVFDTGIDDGVCFIVMELRQASTLREILTEKGPLHPGEAARIVLAVLQGLAHAHREGVIHRDLKPDNVLVDADGTVKVTDFGIASAVSAGRDLTTAAELLDRVAYVAPEELAEGDVDERADIYAAGVILYELLTGQLPVAADPQPTPSGQPVHLDVAPPGALRGWIPEVLAGVAMRALAHEPEDRFQTAEDMAAALSPAVPPPTVTAPVALPRDDDERDMEPLAERSFFRTWMAGPLVLLAAAAIATGGFLVFQQVQQPEDPAPAEGRLLEIASATDHDPLGDGQENPMTAASAVDGDTETSWSTEGYSNAELGGLKEGVGLVLDLGATRDIAGIDLQTPLPGWEFELYGGEDPEAADEPISSDGATSFVAESETALELEPSRYRYVLVWVTELAAAPDGRFRAQVAEVNLLPPSG
ncbi:MAG TPA: protein kinase, partial [Actinomycetota bacterium]|nr:protein kinase [Actinomycetota bacterium]